ncbi:MAG: protein kinase [Polyangiaceae bacterium]
MTAAPFVGRRSAYIPVDVAGRGAASTVFRGVDASSGAHVAVKRIASPDAPARARLAREIAALSAVRHDAVVSFVDEGETPEGPFVVMTWVDGPTLRERLDEGPLAEAEWFSLAVRLCEGLGAIHAAGLVHRDVKPANVVLPGGDPGRAVIVDLGLARTEADASITQTGLCVGTPAYMPPEQARGERGISPAADIFSLGAVLYQCASGEPPFRGTNAIAVLAKLLTLRHEPLRARVSWVPSWLDALVAQMLSRRPETRPRSVEAVRAALEARAEASAAEGDVIDARDTELRPMSVLFARVIVGEVRPSDETETDIVPDDEARIVIDVCERFGGRALRLSTGGVVAFFAQGSAARDFASLAARAALALREVVPRARVVVTTGTVLASEVADEVPQDAADAAMRLLGADPRPMVVIDEVTRALVGERFDVVDEGGLLGLQGVRRNAPPGPRVRGRDVPIVGRELELAQLELAVDHAVSSAEPLAMLVVGPPGSGKSTLEGALAQRLSVRPEVRLVRARADALRREVPYAYLGELLAARYSPEGAPRDFASLVAAMVAWGVEPSVAEGIGAALGPPDIARHDPASARARLVEGLSVSLARDTERLTVVLADDVHWADTPSLAVLAAAVAKVSERFVFVGFSRVGTSELAAPPFADLGLREVRVGKLTPRAAEALVRAVAPDLSLPSPALRPIVEVADGNPLYLEELARSALSGPFEGLRAEGSLLTILQARCVAVGAVERRVLRAASVLGESFEETELVDVLDVLEPAVVREALSELERQELLARRVDEGPRRFRHALVRDAAYSLLTEQELVAFHGRAFDVLSGRGIGSAAELARHAEGAGRLEIAATQWVRSAEEWLAANDMARAIEVVRRALACAGPEVAAEAKVLGSVAAFFAGDIPLSFGWGIEGILDAPRESPAWLRCVGYLMAVVGHLRPPRRPEPLERAVEHLVVYEPPPHLVVRAAEATALAAQVLTGLRVADLALARACVARLVSLARLDASPEARGWIAFGLGWAAHYAGISEAKVVELATACHGAFREVEDTRNLVAADVLWARGLVRDEDGERAASAEAYADRALEVASALGGFPLLFARIHREAVVVALVERGFLGPERLEGVTTSVEAAKRAMPESAYVRAECDTTLARALFVMGEHARAQDVAMGVLSLDPLSTVAMHAHAVILRCGDESHLDAARALLEATGPEGEGRSQLEAALSARG